MLVDTAVWVDHLRGGDPVLVELLEQARVSVHPFVVGEVACGNLTQRAAVLESMAALPMLASVSVADEVLFTRDCRLQAAAEGLGLAAHF